MKTLLILGSSRGLFDDLARLNVQSDARLQDFDLLAINDAIMAFPKAQHLASYHEELFPGWLLRRGRETFDGKFLPKWDGLVTHSQRDGQFIKRVHVFRHGGGTSTFFGCLVAASLGYDRAILCGAPLDTSGHFFDPPWRAGHDYRKTDGWDIWLKAKEEGELDHCRSVSGHTQDLLGFPPDDWYALAGSANPSGG